MTDDLQNLLAGMVKPLEFVEGEFPDERKGGDYHIWAEGHGFQVYFWSIVQGDPHRTLKEAEDWAQAHHRARIASALNLDAGPALVAAAYADAAEMMDCQDYVAGKVLRQDICCDGHMCGCKGASVADYLQHRIRSRTRTDATAALTRMLADARADERKRAKQICDECAEQAKEDNGTGWASHSWLKAAARTIEALEGE